MPIHAGSVISKAVTNGVVVNVDDTYGAVAYRGYTLRATAAAVVNVRVASATGLILDTISLATDEADQEFYSEAIDCPGDLYCEIVSGTVVGSLRYS